MALTFDKIPSVVEIPIEKPKDETTVADELHIRQESLKKRTTKCKIIKPLYGAIRKKPNRYLYKFICVCPRYHPNYCCKHVGNIIIDRDVLTKDEHICFLATPKANHAAPRKNARYYQKKAVVPNCTARIETLALPSLVRVKGTLQDFEHLLTDRHNSSLKKFLDKKTEIQYTNIQTALSYIEEERRLARVAKIMEKRRCKRIKRNIKRKQRKQIRKIVCVLFEEMKDFLLNDQFLVDERSTLCAVILEQIKNFTNKDFYTTSNLREYQQILANNITVWINKFISNLNILVSPPNQKTDKLNPESFLPVRDYISCSESLGDDEYANDDNCYEYGEEEEIDYDEHMEIPSDETITNTNP